MGHDNHVLVTCICRKVNAENREMNQVCINQITRVYDTAHYTTRYRVTETFLLLCYMYIPIFLLFLVIVFMQQCCKFKSTFLFHSSHAPTSLFILILLLLFIPLSLRLFTGRWWETLIMVMVVALMSVIILVVWQSLSKA